MENDDILGSPMTDADLEFGYTLEELRAAVKEGLESGTSKFTWRRLWPRHIGGLRGRRVGRCRVRIYGAPTTEFLVEWA